MADLEVLENKAYQDRVIAEYNGVLRMYCDLNSFLLKYDEGFIKANEREVQLLRTQRTAMYQYLKALQARIDYYKGSEND